MPLDPNIITSGRPVRLPDAEGLMRLSQLSTQGQAQKMALASAQRQAQQQATLSDLYSKNLKPDGSIDRGAITQGMASAGYGDQIPALQEQAQKAQAGDLSNQTAQLSLHKKKLDLVNGTMSALLADKDLTHDKVINSISGLVDQGVIDANQGAQMVRTLPGPNELRPFLISKAMETMDASQQLTSMLAMAPKYDEQDRGGVINQGAIDPLNATRTPGVDVAKTATPGEKLTAAAKAGQRAPFTPEEADLMGALAEAGVNLPAGMRSREQMKSTFGSLLARNPNLSADDIAQKIASGQINLGAEKKETTTAAAQAGKIAVAQNEIREFGPLVLQSSAAVPRGNFVPWSQLKQMADSSISDPALIAFKTQMTALNNAYDSLAARGGTDMAKRAHVHELFNTANSPEAVQSLVAAIGQEAEAADRAARKATQRRPAETDAAGGDVPPDVAALLKKHGG